ncbi:MAG: hypothetical protein NTW67_04270 [Candidatus Woesearchaeota archaeon]|nr:hypothetical protein [Candidatus Woesearchaeota archaeon]
MAEPSNGQWYDLFFGLAAGALIGAIGMAYISAQRDPAPIVKIENPSIETILEPMKRSEKKSRDVILNNAEQFLMQGNADYARKNIDQYLSMNPSQEERLKALKVLDKIATHYRENNRPEQCAEIYRLVSEMEPVKVKTIMNPENVGLAKSLESLAQDNH